MAQIDVTNTNPTSNQVLLDFPPPLKRKSVNQTYDEREVTDYLKGVDAYLNDTFFAVNELNTAITDGYIVDGIRVRNLDAGSILAESIITNKLFIGADQHIVLDGPNQVIEIFDDQATPEKRIRLGKVGAGDDAWGIQVFDPSGTKQIDLATLAQIEWAIINNVVINTADIADAAITNLKVANAAIANANIIDGTIQSAKIGSVDAATITVGKLTADGSPVSIEITGAGALLFSAGGDAIHRPTSTDQSVVKFQSSGGTDVGDIRTLGSASNPSGIQIRSLNGDNVEIASTGTGADILLNSADRITIGGTVESSGSSIRFDDDLIPNVDGGQDLGINILNQWGTLHADATSVPDILFQSGWYLAEGYIFNRPDEDYLILMDNEDNLRMVWTKGYLYTDEIRPLSECPLQGLSRQKSISDALRMKDVYWEKTSRGWLKKYKKYADQKVVRTSDGKILTDKDKDKLYDEHEDRVIKKKELAKTKRPRKKYGKR